MKKWILSTLVLFALAAGVRAEIDENDVAVAIALAKAKVIVLNPVVTENAPPQEKTDMAAYAAAREKAVFEKKTLVVWVGHKDPVTALELSDCVVVNVDADLFKRGKQKEVLVGKYFAGNLYIVPGVEVGDSATVIRQKVNNYVVNIPTITQPQPNITQPGIIQQGGCPGGNCPIQPRQGIPIQLGTPIRGAGCSSGG